MDAQFEPELRPPVPRHPCWRSGQGRLWPRVLLRVPPTLLLAAIQLLPVKTFLMASLGSAVQARIVHRHVTPTVFQVTVEYPRRPWSGPDFPAQEVLDIPVHHRPFILRAKSLPALRLGRGRLQMVRVETDGEVLKPWEVGVALVGLMPLVAIGFLVLWGSLLREWWLVAWGRPVQGLVRRRFQRAPAPGRWFLSYEYREMAGPSASVLLHGTASVTQAEYEQAVVGGPVTVLHALWNPRWHVAYPYCRFEARDRERDQASTS